LGLSNCDGLLLSRGFFPSWISFGAFNCWM
jgi:hypothetical protein